MRSAFVISGCSCGPAQSGLLVKSYPVRTLRSWHSLNHPCPWASIRARRSFSSDMSSSTGLSVFRTHQQRHLNLLLAHPPRSGSGWLSIRRSRSSSALWVSSAISRRDTTGFLSLSRSTVRSIRTCRNLARTMGGQHHQFEPVRYLVYAVFNRHAGHRRLSTNESKWVRKGELSKRESRY